VRQPRRAAHRPRRGRRPRGRPHPRAARRSRDAAGVRRLRVPVLLERRADDQGPAELSRRRALRLAPPAAQRRARRRARRARGRGGAQQEADAMTQRWFDPDELEQLSRPTMDRAIEALDAGDADEARRLCEGMKHEWLMLHDLMAESVLSLISFVQEKLGDEGVKEAWEQSTEKGWRRHHDAIGRMDRRQLVYLLAATWRAHSGSGVGDHPGRFTITED